MKAFGYVWMKDQHEAKFYWTEQPAKDIQKHFGGEVVPVFKPFNTPTTHPVETETV